MGLSPAGFIMNITMNRAMTTISTVIMKRSAVPRYSARSSTSTAPTFRNEASSRNEARIMESTRNTR